jgi:serine/threonine protein kinase
MDIKLENILLDSYYNVKLADFGSALRVTDEKGSVDRQRGTVVYMAPEVANHKNKETYSAFSADVYSLGVTLFVLLVGEFPLSAGSNTATMDTETTMQEKGISPNSEIIQQRWDLLSEEVKDLIGQMT